jgi:hypothetical protein
MASRPSACRRGNASQVLCYLWKPALVARRGLRSGPYRHGRLGPGLLPRRDALRRPYRRAESARRRQLDLPGRVASQVDSPDCGVQRRPQRRLHPVQRRRDDRPPGRGVPPGDRGKHRLHLPGGQPGQQHPAQVRRQVQAHMAGVAVARGLASPGTRSGRGSAKRQDQRRRDGPTAIEPPRWPWPAAFTSGARHPLPELVEGSARKT